MLALIQHLNAIHPLPEELQQYLFKSLKQKRLKPGDVWLKEGLVCTNVAFVEEGLFKAHYYKRCNDCRAFLFRANSLERNHCSL